MALFGIVLYKPVGTTAVGNPIVVSSLPSSLHLQPEDSKPNVASMCFPEDAPPARVYDRDIARIQVGLAFLNATGESMPRDLPPAFLFLNSATIDLPPGQADALNRQLLETFFPINSGESTSQPPSDELKQDVIRYFSYAASPEARNLETRHLMFPDDGLMRRLLRSLPPRLTLASWVAKTILSHLTEAAGHRGAQLYTKDEDEGIILARTPDVEAKYMRQPRMRRLKSGLDFLPKFMAHLTVKFAEWLPFELQYLTAPETPEQYREAFLIRDTEYAQGFETPMEAGDRFFLYRSHAVDFLQNRGWFDLPFADDLLGTFYDCIDSYTQEEDTEEEDSREEDSQGEDSRGEDSREEDSREEDSRGEDSRGEDSRGEDSQGEDSRGEDSREED